MASSNAVASMEPPPKRQKLSPTPTTTPENISQPPQNIAKTTQNIDTTMAEAPSASKPTDGFQFEREASVGILLFVNDKNPGFAGILKQRYTDFLVNEIAPDGTVVHLRSLNPPKLKQLLRKNQDAPSDQVPRAAEPVESTEKNSKETEFPNTTSTEPSTEKSNGAPENVPQADFTISSADEALLDSHFGPSVTGLILAMNKRILQRPDAKSASHGSVLSAPIVDRQTRTQIHQDMRRIFDSRFETSSNPDGVIKITATAKVKPNPRHNSRGDGPKNPNEKRNKGKLGWDELGGEYLHFSLYKENKDTMEIIGFLAHKSRQKPKAFAFAGTKDRRAVTVQRVSAFRVNADQLANMNRILFGGSKVGDFKYEKHGLELGELAGNEFVITLRDCRFSVPFHFTLEEKLAVANKVVGQAMENLKTHGYLNYYGLQRFGSYGIGTDIVGLKILQGDFEGAVKSILTYDIDVLEAALIPKDEWTAEQLQYSKDDIDRAWAIFKFNRTGSSKASLERLPRRFAAETAIIRHLSNPARANDYPGAIQQITRNLRLMYVHAYQSLVWNMVLSERWARFGRKVITGDLIYDDSKAESKIAAIDTEEFDQNGEIVVLPAADDVAISSDDIFQRARPLTAEEAASGKYSIFDIVLPTPGFDIEYPNNEIGDFYKNFMASERGGGLDPSNMRRPQKDFSLSGSYRKILGEIGKETSFEVKHYTDDNEQFIQTDLEKISGEKRPEPKQASAGKSSSWSPGHSTLDPAEQARGVNAWKALPAKLNAEDKAQIAVLALELEADPATTAEPKPLPAFKDTYIQTSVTSGRAEHTGYRDTTVLYSTEATSMLPPPTPKAPSTITSSETDESDGGVPLPPREAHAKLPCTSFPGNGVSASSDTTSTTDSDGGVVLVQPKLAVIVKFQLGSSQYATMALRELMKQGGVTEYKPDFGSSKLR